MLLLLCHTSSSLRGTSGGDSGGEVVEEKVEVRGVEMVVEEKVEGEEVPIVVLEEVLVAELQAVVAMVGGTVVLVGEK